MLWDNATEQLFLIIAAFLRELPWPVFQTASCWFGLSSVAATLLVTFSTYNFLCVADLVKNYQSARTASNLFSYGLHSFFVLFVWGFFVCLFVLFLYRKKWQKEEKDTNKKSKRQWKREKRQEEEEKEEQQKNIFKNYQYNENTSMYYENTSMYYAEAVSAK